MVSFRAFLPVLPALLVLALPWPVQGKVPCRAPDAVCDAASRVFRIASFDPLASAVLIEPGLLVTNRHAVADNRRAEVFGPSGRRVLADVVPSVYAGDLILLSAPELAAEGPLATADAGAEDKLYTIGADVGRGAIRVYRPGRRLMPVAEGKGNQYSKAADYSAPPKS